MTNDRTDRIFQLGVERSKHVEEQLLPFLRTLETQLRDLCANHTADRLAALVGRIDELDNEALALITEDPKGALLEMLLKIQSARS